MAGRRPLLLRDGYTWEFAYDCRTAARTFWQLLVDDFRANENFVFEVLGITREIRKAQGNLITPKDEATIFTPEELAERRKQKVSRLKTLRSINKGLAMELLVATMLSCLDSPKAVRPWCAVSAKGHPKMYAGAGDEDILATYGGFCIVAEVSAKRDASTDAEFFRDQLEQALHHAGKVAKRGAGGVVYALVINKCSVDTNHRIEGIYRDILKRYLETRRTSGKDPNRVAVQGIRLIPIRSHDFFQIMDGVVADGAMAGFAIGSDRLKQALEEVYLQLHGRNIADDKRWMAVTMARTLGETAEPADEQLVPDTGDEA